MIAPDVLVTIRAEDLRNIELQLAQEKAARQRAEAELAEVLKERSALSDTIQKFTEYFGAHCLDAGILPSGRKISSNDGSEYGAGEIPVEGRHQGEDLASS